MKSIENNIYKTRKIIEHFDWFVSLSIASTRNKFFTNFLLIFTYTASGIAWCLYFVIILFFKLNHSHFIIMETTLIKALIFTFISWGIGNYLKKIFKRKRPFQIMPNFKSLTNSPINDSFPSMHTGSTFTFVLILVLNHYPYSPLLICWALVVIFSRIYLGVHFFSDLMGGIILAIFCSSLSFFMK